MAPPEQALFPSCAASFLVTRNPAPHLPRTHNNTHPSPLQLRLHLRAQLRPEHEDFRCVLARKRTREALAWAFARAAGASPHVPVLCPHLHTQLRISPRRRRVHQSCARCESRRLRGDQDHCSRQPAASRYALRQSPLAPRCPDNPALLLQLHRTLPRGRGGAWASGRPAPRAATSERMSAALVETRQLFARFDKDGSGVVTQTEFKQATKEVRATMMMPRLVSSPQGALLASLALPAARAWQGAAPASPMAASTGTTQRKLVAGRWAGAGSGLDMCSAPPYTHPPNHHPHPLADLRGGGAALADRAHECSSAAQQRVGALAASAQWHRCCRPCLLWHCDTHALFPLRGRQQLHSRVRSPLTPAPAPSCCALPHPP